MQVLLLSDLCRPAYSDVSLQQQSEERDLKHSRALHLGRGFIGLSETAGF